jgi:hypothetical protein
MAEESGSESFAHHPPSVSATSAPSFIGLRLAPIVVTLILALSNVRLWVSALLILPLAFADFYLTKSHFGPLLVGLRWNIDASEAPNFPFLVCFSRPLPFVASTRNSNVFWVGLTMAAMLDALLLVVLAAARGLGWATLSVVMLCPTVLNILGFIKCYRIAKTTADMAVRTMLIDGSVMFQVALSDTLSDQQPGPGDGIESTEVV